MGAWLAIEGAIFIILLTVAWVSFRPGAAAAYVEKQIIYSRGHMWAFVAIALCYAIISGLDDNIRYFLEEAGNHSEFIYEFIYLFGAVVYIAAGYMTDKLKPVKNLVTISFAAVCVIFFLLFFASSETMDFIYAIFSKIPIYMLWVIFVTLPIRFSKRQSNPSFAGFGYAILYSGMIPTSVLFYFFPEEYFRVVIAFVFIFALAALIAVFHLSAALEKQNFRLHLNTKEDEISLLAEEITALKSNIIPPDFSSFAAAYDLTDKESDLLPLISGLLTAEEIAKEVHLSVRTIKFHTGNILKKTSCKNRRELRTFIESYTPKDITAHFNGNIKP
jgi:DNA-binding CsgD family transcriptional regulator